MPVDGYSQETAARSFEVALEQFQLADEVGFDWVTLAEHHFAPLSLTPNPMVMAGALTRSVKRARIALLGSNIPIQNPVRVAEEFAMLDVLSGGRIIAGMLRGTSNEYVTYNTNPAESRERFQEAMALIVRAWTEPQPFGWQGRYYEFRSISIWPRPVQQPHPPIYMSGSSPEMGEFAARNHVSLGFAVTTLDLARAASRHYREQATLAGWQPCPDDILYRVGIHVAETDEQAFADLGEAAGVPAPRLGGYARSNLSVDDAVARSGYYGRDLENQRGRVRATGDLAQRIERGQLLLGGPQSVAEQIRRLRDEIGCGVLDRVFSAGRDSIEGRDKTLRAIELFGEKVLPRIRDL